MDTTNTNSREYKHEHRDKLCYCCDEVQENESRLHELRISGRGYGSSFDNFNSYILLCDKCLKQKYKEWFNEHNDIYDDFNETYEHEKDIGDLVNSLPLENQEYFWNSNAYGASASIIMDRQDWIDMKNGTMTDEKYKEYSMYSPSEKKAYKEKFPTCEYPVNKIYDDGSKGCWCPFLAHGEYGQKVDEHNTSIECYYCKYYKKRDTSIKNIKGKDWKDYKLYIEYKLKEDNLEKKFGNL